MRRILNSMTIGVCAGALISLSAFAQPAAPDMSLTRLDCGTSPPPVDAGRFIDTFANPGLKFPQVFSCYLIKHGDDYMLWDTGQPMSTAPVAPKVSIVDQLAQLKVTPDQVKHIGISHYHGDHTGQAGSFPQAMLLIGKGDWDVLTSPKPPAGVNPAPLANWITGGGKVEPVPLDKDVFGDGTVVMLATPGHTPGHHSVLVRLGQSGNMLITGDLAHFHENYDSDGVPTFNTSRAETLASLDRFKKIAANLKATVILQHDGRDIGKLPPFPAAAR